MSTVILFFIGVLLGAKKIVTVNLPELNIFEAKRTYDISKLEGGMFELTLQKGQDYVVIEYYTYSDAHLAGKEYLSTGFSAPSLGEKHFKNIGRNYWRQVKK